MTSTEALCFLFILLVAAIIAAVYVLRKGLERGDRNKFKLLLSCSHIVTAVVPPEFPITLTLAVTLSLLFFVRRNIFCTEPFRVPLAGKVDVCAFDKTGTLTSDKMVAVGVIGIEGSPMLTNKPQSIEAARKRRLSRYAAPSEKPLTPNGGGVTSLSGKEGEGSTSGQQTAQQLAEQTVLSQRLPFLTTAVLAGCNSIAEVDKKIVGDPMEIAAVTCVDWKVKDVDVVASKLEGARQDTLTIIKRWPFESEEARMTVIARHQGPCSGWSGTDDVSTAGNGEASGKTSDPPKRLSNSLLLVKGAPEKLKPLLRSLPSDYDTQVWEHSVQGYRLLALGAKWLDKDARDYCGAKLKRSDLEKDLHFCGFLVLSCPIKPNTTTTISSLHRSLHSLMMITGDNPLTACQVAMQVGIAQRSFVSLSPRLNSSSEASTAPPASQTGSEDGSPLLDGTEDEQKMFEWRDRDGNFVEAFSLKLSHLRNLTKRHSLCVVGAMLQQLEVAEKLILIPFVTVFARVAPDQKEEIIVSLKRRGLTTLMCGDGTNDVGALKAAHVGVSIPSNPIKLPPKKNAMQLKLPPLPPGKTMPKWAEKLQEQQEDGMPIVRLGDASVASPFTCKEDNIRCVNSILRGGRATLATVLQLYKIMCINSLITAFALSVLTIDGVKLGDAQSTIENLYISFLFFFLSQAKPSRRLSPERPISSVFHPGVLLSLIGQLAIHLIALIWGWRASIKYRAPDFKADVDGTFKPNLTNTVVYYLIAAMHISSFLANYEGAPFMTPFFDNKLMFYGVGGFLAGLGLLITESLPFINTYLDLVPFPDPSFRRFMVFLVILSVGGSWIISTAVNLFARWFDRFFRVHRITCHATIEFVKGLMSKETAEQAAAEQAESNAKKQS